MGEKQFTSRTTLERIGRDRLVYGPLEAVFSSAVRSIGFI